MDWFQLQYFKTVAEVENMTQASKLLHISQPSLSQTIKRLETELGYPLFFREGKKIRLNETGEILLHAVEQMNQIMENSKLAMDEKNGKEVREVSLYIGCASMLLASLLQHLKKCTPEIEYRINQWSGEVKNKEADFSIVSAPVEDIQGNARLLLRERILLALPQNHPFVEKEKIYISDLKDEEFISLNENWSLWETMRKAMESASFEPKIIMRVDNPSLMRELLSCQMGVAFVPEVTWHSFAGENIVMRLVEGCSMERNIWLKYKENRYLSHSMKACADGIEEFFGRLLY
ncbi:LysR family transcriptional regulator [Anaerosporobacter sp.]|uniref:LysR family transcriptional regulator n=1 Tax=Anaerosporobacter sp. TaxID=1872529 RepID=UPI00286F0DF6|nr:LysR family transcriptional regulator [Anaerosporobacter sp.]